MNRKNRETSKMITLTAFLIGYVLIDHLNSNEQSAVGNFFMLIGQTLCTCGGENFKRDWAPFQNPTNMFNGNDDSQDEDGTSREEVIDMLDRVRNVFDQEIDHLKS